MVNFRARNAGGGRPHVGRMRMRPAMVAAALLALLACAAPRQDEADASRERLARLAAEVQAAEDVSAIKRLQRSYGYFLDKGMWTELAEYFTDDAVASDPAGVFISRQSIRQHLRRNADHVPAGQAGPAGGRLSNHMIIQPVLHLDAAGDTARGRWRALVMSGSLDGSVTWTEGIHQMQYRREDGVWKIARLDYHAGSANPAGVEGARVWPQREPAYAAARFAGITGLARRVERLQDELEVENLQRLYGYHLDRAQWDQLAELFVDDAAIQFGPKDVYIGKARIRDFLGTLASRGPTPGGLNDHLQLQPVVTIIDDPRTGLITARVRSRQLGMSGQAGGKSQWSEGLYENWLVKEGATWKFTRVHFFPTSIIGQDPIPPYHYENPVSRQPATYPPGSVDEQLARPVSMPLPFGQQPDPQVVRDPAAALTEAERRIARVKDHLEIENLVSAYGYQQGPAEGCMDQHIPVQPLIQVEADGKAAKVRSRMLQHPGMNGCAARGGAIHENELVKEAGIWKFREVLLAQQPAQVPTQAGSAARGTLPPAGPAAAPDPLRTARQDLLVTPPIAVPPPGMPPEVAASLREIGPVIDAAQTIPLYAPLHAGRPDDSVQVRRDLAYGPDPRHRADVFTERGTSGAPRPLLVFSYGGGFRGGAKSSADTPFYDNIGYWAAENGMVGVTINYRLAPQFTWPAGADDIARVVAWLREQAASWGADPSQIFLWGHSSGAAHVADYLVRTPDAPVRAAILMSGIYSLGAETSMWSAYYGEDVSQYPGRSSLPRLIQLPLPILAVSSELDAPNFIPDTEGLIEGRRAAGRPVTGLWLPNHSHLSMAYAIGTEDTSLTAPLLQFIRDHSTPGEARR